MLRNNFTLAMMMSGTTTKTSKTARGWAGLCDSLASPGEPTTYSFPLAIAESSVTDWKLLEPLKEKTLLALLISTRAPLVE
jgi:hypothetical protein